MGFRVYKDGARLINDSGYSEEHETLSEAKKELAEYVKYEYPVNLYESQFEIREEKTVAWYSCQIIASLQPEEF